jgi:hypothetical protein
VRGAWKSRHSGFRVRGQCCLGLRLGWFSVFEGRLGLTSFVAGGLAFSASYLRPFFQERLKWSLGSGSRALG